MAMPQELVHCVTHLLFYFILCALEMVSFHHPEYEALLSSWKSLLIA